VGKAEFTCLAVGIVNEKLGRKVDEGTAGGRDLGLRVELNKAMTERTIETTTTVTVLCHKSHDCLPRQYLRLKTFQAQANKAVKHDCSGTRCHENKNTTSATRFSSQQETSYHSATEPSRQPALRR
jgi:hypothetical protein